MKFDWRQQELLQLARITFHEDYLLGTHRQPAGNMAYDAEYERLAAEHAYPLELWGDINLTNQERRWLEARREYCRNKKS